MSAHADDERFHYATVLGRSTALTGAAASSQRSAALEPGLYAVRVSSFDSATALWFRQGNADVVAAAAEPSTMFVPPTDAGFLNAPMFHMIVRGLSPSKAGSPAGAAAASADDHLAVFQVAGTSADIQITKISRGKG